MRRLGRVLLYAWAISAEGYLGVALLATFLKRGGVAFVIFLAVVLLVLADDWRDAWRGEPFWPWDRSWYRGRER